MTTKKITLLLSAVLLSCLGIGSAAAATPPIVFVHGYSGAGFNWDTMVSRFRASGYPGDRLYKFNYSSLINSNKTSASQLRTFVNDVRNRHGGEKVAIVAHSNGGLVSRWYRVMLGGSSANYRFISLGSPHKGTTTAYACFSPACYEMQPYSGFLRDLAGRGCERSLWSALDGIILPASSAQCGTSYQTPSIDHLSLLTNSTVYQMVRNNL